VVVVVVVVGVVVGMITKEELDKIRGTHISGPGCVCSDCSYEVERSNRLLVETSRHPDYKWKDNEGVWHSIDSYFVWGD
jgi:hypothetical protein